MRNTLVIYSSVDGHTQKISSKIAEHIKHHANVDLTLLLGPASDMVTIEKNFLSLLKKTLMSSQAKKTLFLV